MSLVVNNDFISYKLYFIYYFKLKILILINNYEYFIYIEENA